MKRALVISPSFTPSNLAGVMRARFLSAHLPEFGWQPVVLAAHPAEYEEVCDERSLALLPPGLRVERVGAWPSKICRPIGFGDISLRSQTALRRRIAQIIAREKVDLIFCTVLPGYTMLAGAWAKKKFRVPFVLDYQDPWVTQWGAQQPCFSKAGLAHRLAARLEPAAAGLADAFTAVSAGTLDTLRERGIIRPETPVEIIPIGADENDHAVAAKSGTSLIQNSDFFNLAYVGTLTERMLPALKTILLAVKKISDARPELRLRVHLIGTSAQSGGGEQHGLAAWLRESGMADLAVLKPARAPYLDALRTMQSADALLLPGSTDTHYTASKIFPYWLARRPVFGFFHAASEIVPLARELGGVRLVAYESGADPAARLCEVAAALEETLSGKNIPARNEGAFAAYSARAAAGRFAKLFDRVGCGF